MVAPLASARLAAARPDPIKDGNLAASSAPPPEPPGSRPREIGAPARVPASGRARLPTPLSAGAASRQMAEAPGRKRPRPPPGRVNKAQPTSPPLKKRETGTAATNGREEELSSAQPQPDAAALQAVVQPGRAGNTPAPTPRRDSGAETHEELSNDDQPPKERAPVDEGQEDQQGQTLETDAGEGKQAEELDGSPAEIEHSKDEVDTLVEQVQEEAAVEGAQVEKPKEQEAEKRAPTGGTGLVEKNALDGPAVLDNVDAVSVAPPEVEASVPRSSLSGDSTMISGQPEAEGLAPTSAVKEAPVGGPAAVAPPIDLPPPAALPVASSAVSQGQPVGRSAPLSAEASEPAAKVPPGPLSSGAGPGTRAPSVTSRPELDAATRVSASLGDEATGRLGPSKIAPERAAASQAEPTARVGANADAVASLQATQTSAPAAAAPVRAPALRRPQQPQPQPQPPKQSQPRQAPPPQPPAVALDVSPPVSPLSAAVEVSAPLVPTPSHLASKAPPLPAPATPEEESKQPLSPLSASISVSAAGRPAISNSIAPRRRPPPGPSGSWEARGEPHGGSQAWNAHPGRQPQNQSSRLERSPDVARADFSRAKPTPPRKSSRPPPTSSRRPPAQQLRNEDFISDKYDPPPAYDSDNQDGYDDIYTPASSYNADPVNDYDDDAYLYSSSSARFSSKPDNDYEDYSYGDSFDRGEDRDDDPYQFKTDFGFSDRGSAQDDESSDFDYGFGDYSSSASDSYDSFSASPRRSKPSCAPPYSRPYDAARQYATTGSASYHTVDAFDAPRGERSYAVSSWEPSGDFFDADEEDDPFGIEGDGLYGRNSRSGSSRRSQSSYQSSRSPKPREDDWYSYSGSSSNADDDLASYGYGDDEDDAFSSSDSYYDSDKPKSKYSYEARDSFESSPFYSSSSSPRYSSSAKGGSSLWDDYDSDEGYGTADFDSNDYDSNDFDSNDFDSNDFDSNDYGYSDSFERRSTGGYSSFDRGGFFRRLARVDAFVAPSARDGRPFPSRSHPSFRASRAASVSAVAAAASGLKPAPVYTPARGAAGRFSASAAGLPKGTSPGDFSGARSRQ
eukprot:GHVT01041323.1.p1 GENE.GHVT01041323.1~~GHVT01041323.1.p1  ORF type:complete len:1139 (-),score=313.16 GHVT01041323.1:157-3381(-)